MVERKASQTRIFFQIFRWKALQEKFLLLWKICRYGMTYKLSNFVKRKIEQIPFEMLYQNYSLSEEGM